MFIRTSILASMLASTLLALSLVACGDEAATSSGDPLDDDALAEANESELRSDGYIGRWTNADGQATHFVSLTLKAGARYEATTTACAPGRASCPEVARVESGRFTILGSGHKKTLRLVPAEGRVRRYQIEFAATVAVVGAPRAIELTRSGTSQILSEQGRPVGEACGESICASGLVCCNPLGSICTRPGEVCAF
jgi:hypothetical protein